MSIRIHKVALAIGALFALSAPLAAQDQAKSEPRAGTASKTEQAAPSNVHARPAMWVVKDKDTTIYLFGTIHLLKPGLIWMEGPMKTALDSADEVVLEIAEDADPATQLALVQRGLDLSGPPLSGKLPEDVRPKLAALLKDIEVPAAVVDRMKPWLAAVTLSAAPLKKLGFDPANGVEAHLRKEAKAQGKKLTGLETAAEQIGIFESLSADLQMRLLVETINEQSEVEKTLDAMIGAWSAGDPDKLAETLNGSMEEDPELADRLLYQRNKHWADWIKERLKTPGTVFLAVGAGHLAGKGSVQNELKARKVKTKQVPTS